MRYLLNGQFEFNGEKYWRVDDIERIEKAGTYNVMQHLRRFGLAINAHNVSHDLAQEFVRVLNEVDKAFRKS